MTYISKFTFNVTCTASGATLHQPVIGGLLHAVRYTVASADPLADGATCTLSVVQTTNATTPGHEVLTFVNASADAMLYPRLDGHTTAAATGGGVGQLIPIANEYLRLVVASGGASGHARFDVYVQGR